MLAPRFSVGWIEKSDAPSPIGTTQVLKGHDFSRAEKGSYKLWALAPEEPLMGRQSSMNHDLTFLDRQEKRN
jgi:hypothetical protein